MVLAHRNMPWLGFKGAIASVSLGFGTSSFCFSGVAG